MKIKARAMFGMILFACTIVTLLSASAIAQSDSTKTDSLIALPEVQMGGKDVSISADTGKNVWSPQDKMLKLSAPTLFTGEIKGRVSAVAGDTLVIEQFRNRESNYIRVPVSAITRCLVHDGTSGHFGTGVLVGAAVGCGTSLLVVAVDDDSDDFIDLSGFVIGAGTVGGAVIGGLIGAFARTDKWKSVPIGSLSLGVQPVNDGKAGISLTLRF